MRRWTLAISVSIIFGLGIGSSIADATLFRQMDTGAELVKERIE